MWSEVARPLRLRYITCTMVEWYETAPSRIGAGIKRRRKALGITQDELARRTGWSQQYVSTLESGNDARLSTVMRLADALECSVSELIGEEV